MRIRRRSWRLRCHLIIKCMSMECETYEETVYSKYAVWCLNNGYQKMNLRNFGRHLTKMDTLKKVRRNSGKYYYLRPVETGMFADAEEASPELAGELNTSIPF